MYKQPVSRRKTTFIFDSVQVIDIERPACTILVTAGTCDPPSLNTSNCSEYTWNSTTMVTVSGTQFERILTNEGNSVVMQYK